MRLEIRVDRGGAVASTTAAETAEAGGVYYFSILAGESWRWPAKIGKKLGSQSKTGSYRAASGRLETGLLHTGVARFNDNDRQSNAELKRRAKLNGRSTFTMTDSRPHAALLTSQLAAPLARLLDPHEPDPAFLSTRYLVEI